MNLRQQARKLFPDWSRRMRAKWVVAKAKAGGLKVPVSAHWPHDRDAYYYRRTA